jgi:hypothetical protein
MIKLVYEINGGDIDSYVLSADTPKPIRELMAHAQDLAEDYGVALHDVTLRFVQEDKVK